VPPRCESLYAFAIPLYRSLSQLALYLVAVVIEEVISEVKSWLQQRPAEWYREGMQALASQSHRAIDLEGDYVEK
jgi:hypothetical protein